MFSSAKITSDFFGKRVPVVLPESVTVVAVWSILTSTLPAPGALVAATTCSSVPPMTSE